MSVETAINTADAPEVETSRHRTKYSPDFRNEAARLVVRDGNKLTDVAKKLHIPDQTLSNWVRKERQGTRRKANVSAVPTPEPISSVRDRLEIQRLKDELAKQTERAQIFEKTVVLLTQTV